MDGFRVCADLFCSRLLFYCLQQRLFPDWLSDAVPIVLAIGGAWSGLGCNGETTVLMPIPLLVVGKKVCPVDASLSALDQGVLDFNLGDVHFDSILLHCFDTKHVSKHINDFLPRGSAPQGEQTLAMNDRQPSSHCGGSKHTRGLPRCDELQTTILSAIHTHVERLPLDCFIG